MYLFNKVALFLINLLFCCRVVSFISFILNDSFANICYCFFVKCLFSCVVLMLHAVYCDYMLCWCYMRCIVITCCVDVTCGLLWLHVVLMLHAVYCDYMLCWCYMRCIVITCCVYSTVDCIGCCFLCHLKCSNLVGTTLFCYLLSLLIEFLCTVFACWSVI